MVISKRIPQCKLDLAIGAETRGRADGSQAYTETVGRREIRAGIRKLGCVKDVEHLSPELNRLAFADPEILEQRKVKVVSGRALQKIAPHIAESAIGGPREG